MARIVKPTRWQFEQVLAIYKKSRSKKGNEENIVHYTVVLAMLQEMVLVWSISY